MIYLNDVLPEAQFAYGPYEDFLNAQKSADFDESTVYWITDKFQIYKGRQLYATNVGQITPEDGEIFSTYEGTNVNKALSEASAAFGQNNIAGCLGFKVSNFVKGTSTEGAKVTLNTDATHFANIEVGDLVSVKINYNATGLKVTAIDTTNKVVTLDYKLSTFPDFVASDNDYLWLCEKPEAGDTSIGTGAFAAGFKGNQANQDGSLALGRDNIADGRFSVALGTGNKAGYNTFTFGKNNNALHAESTSVFGTSNIIENCYDSLFIGKSNNALTQTASFVFGSNNSLAENGGNNFILGSNNSLAKNSSNSVLLGNHLKTLKGYCYYVGQWNKPVTSTTDPERFSVGIGDSEGSRKNGFTIYQSGYGEIYAQGVTDKSIVQKQYVDTNLENKLDKVTSTAVRPRTYIINADGTQGTLSYTDSSAVAYTLAQRTSAGNIIVAAPTIDTHAATKKYVDDELSKKLNKSVPASGFGVPMIKSDGTETLVKVASGGVTASAFMLTTTTGAMFVGTPTVDNHAANKKYVDDAIGTKQDTLVSGTNIKTINGSSILGSGNIVIEGGGGGGTSITVDDSLSSTSTNPVQNKVINAALENKQDAFTYDSGTWSATFDKGINFEFKGLNNTLMNVNVGSLLIKGKEIPDLSTFSVNIDSDTQTAVLSTGSADATTTQGISFKGTTPGGTKIPVPILDVPAIKSPSNSPLKLFGASDIIASTANYSMSWDSTSQAIKITFN